MPRTLKPITYPKRIEARYRKALLEYTKDMSKDVSKVLVQPLRQDAIGDDIAGAIDTLKARFRGKWTDNRLRAIAQDIFDRIQTHIARDADKKWGKVIPIRPIKTKRMQDLSSMFVRENVELIKSIDARYFDEVERLVMDHVKSGSRVETLQKQIQDRFKVGQSRAKLIAQDQSAKLTSDLTTQKQKDAGIEKAEWSSSQDERVRKSHRKANGKVYDLGKGLLVDGVRTFPGKPVRCFPGTTPVHSVSGCQIAYRRRYSGDLVSITTGTNEVLLVTPNHPILTIQGWIPAKSIDVGSYLVHKTTERLLAGYTDNNHAEPTIAQVFRTLELVGFPEPTRGMAAQFHGDGSTNSDVDVVGVHPELLRYREPTLTQSACQEILTEAFMGLPSLPGSRDFELVLLSQGLAPDGSVRGLGKLLALVDRACAHTSVHTLATIADVYPVLFQNPDYDISTDAISFCQRFDAYVAMVGGYQLLLWELYRSLLRTGVLVDGRVKTPSSKVLAEIVRVAPDIRRGGGQCVPRPYEVHGVVDVGFEYFTGHVYNLQTAHNWYTAKGVVAHNCRCVSAPVLEDDD